MKRKLLNNAKEFDRRSRNRESVNEEEADSNVALKVWESDGDASDSEENVDENDNLEPKKKVKGKLSEKDKQILKVRKAETSKIETIVPYRNKQRTLVFCSRGVTSRFRHLLEDIRSLLPHHKTEVKHDTKKNLYEINDLADMKACNNCIFFEARKSKDLYMWISKTPNGPSIKFHVLNIHTMDELRMSGNCLKGSRPFLSFSQEFENSPTLNLIKEMFQQIFGTPRGHPKSKPFVDHIMTFSIVDGKIWFRHFQITDSTFDAKEMRQMEKSGKESVKLVEIGPRFVLNLIKVFHGSFTGQTLVENPEFITPNAQRSQVLTKKGISYKKRKKEEKQAKERKLVNIIPDDPLSSKSIFK